MALDDAIETIGPCEDPDVASCLMLLIDPTNWPGCVTESMQCRERSGSTALTGTVGDGASVARRLLNVVAPRMSVARAWRSPSSETDDQACIG